MECGLLSSTWVLEHACKKCHHGKLLLSFISINYCVIMKPLHFFLHVVIVICSIHRTWWWDSWVEPNNLYHLFKPFSLFVNQLQLADYTWTAVNPAVGPSQLRSWGMVGQDGEGRELIVTWIQDDCYTWAHQSSGEKCQQWSGETVRIAGCGIPSGMVIGFG